jgi:hypothetical protein
MRDYTEFLNDLEVSMSFKDAELRASRFLLALSYVAQDMVVAEHKLIMKENLVDITFSSLMSTVPLEFKSADARKAWVQRQPEYLKSVEEYAKAKSQADYLRRLDRLFDSAHVYNRQKALKS